MGLKQQWTHEQSGHGDRDGGYMWAQQHGPFFITADLANAIAESQSADTQDKHQNPHMEPFPSGTCQPPSGRLITLDPFTVGWGCENIDPPMLAYTTGARTRQPEPGEVPFLLRCPSSALE